ncbi:MAG: S8 family serine peptidase, partial [Thermodesulfobacteriota bacterium]|nr:S8 family serine peptidase [Thermodesulfobacteriota bacterium]
DDDDDSTLDNQAMSASSGESYEPRTIIAVNLDRSGYQQALHLGLRLKKTIDLEELDMRIRSFQTEPGVDVEDVLRELRKANSNALFDVNHLYGINGDKRTHNDIRDYPLEILNWTTHESKGRGVKIGMIDTVVDTQAPYLKGRRIVTKSFIGQYNSAGAEHGSAIASLIVGKPGSRFPGLLPQASLYAADTFFVDQAGRQQTSAIMIARALNWLLTKDVSVINMSLSGPQNKLLRESVEPVLRRKKVIVAAAGNNGPNGSPVYPAAIEGVIAITAIDRFQRPYAGANQGKYISYAAPGVGIWTPTLDGQGRFRSGTSFAAAYFTAMAADQLNQPGMQQGHKALRKIARKRALDIGSPGKDTIFGWGLVRSP